MLKVNKCFKKLYKLILTFTSKTTTRAHPFYFVAFSMTTEKQLLLSYKTIEFGFLLFQTIHLNVSIVIT